MRGSAIAQSRVRCACVCAVESALWRRRRATDLKVSRSVGVERNHLRPTARCCIPSCACTRRRGARRCSNLLCIPTEHSCYIGRRYLLARANSLAQVGKIAHQFLFRNVHLPQPCCRVLLRVSHPSHWSYRHPLTPTRWSMGLSERCNYWTFHRPPNTHTNHDTTRIRTLDSWILYSDSSRHKRTRIINERREKAGQRDTDPVTGPQLGHHVSTHFSQTTLACSITRSMAICCKSGG